MIGKKTLSEGQHLSDGADQTGAAAACTKRAKNDDFASEEDSTARLDTRKKIREYIARRIEDHITTLDPSIDPRKATILARQLDAKLHNASPSFDTYADTDTLDERLKTLATGIGLQIQRGRTRSKSARAMHDFSEKRKSLLRTRVGDDLYGTIFDLVEEIETIRRTNSTWTTEWAKRKEGEGEKRAASSMPIALREIYFGTRLVEAERSLVAQTPGLHAERVDKPNWEELVDEARRNVATFLEMEKVAKASGKAKLGCGGTSEECTCCFK